MATAWTVLIRTSVMSFASGSNGCSEDVASAGPTAYRLDVCFCFCLVAGRTGVATRATSRKRRAVLTGDCSSHPVDVLIRRRRRYTLHASVQESLNAIAVQRVPDV